MSATAFVSLEKYRADMDDLNEQVLFYKTYFEGAYHQLSLAYYELCQRHYNRVERHLEQAMKLCQSKPAFASVPVSTKPDKFSSVADGVPLHFEFEGER